MKQTKNSKGELFEKARDIAEHFGFASLHATLSDAQKFSTRTKKISFKPPKEGVPGEADRVTLIRTYVEQNLTELPQPLMLYHSEPLPRSLDRAEYGGKTGILFSLEVIGSSKSIAEATLFKTTASILKECGFENFHVVINSLGDRDSINRFNREFTNYYRKHMEDVPAHCRNLLKKDVFKVLECAENACMLVKEQAPKPIATLTEESRAHFSEVLEFLEGMNIPYVINNCLVGGKEYFTRTIFEIRTDESVNKLFPKATFNAVLARGGRFDDLAKRFGAKKEAPSVGISISLGGLGIHEPRKNIERVKKSKSPIYLIHLGMFAKQKSLNVLEMLRRSKIPVCQSLSRDKIAIQVVAAEKMSASHTIIIGQKEALEDTVIVRNMKNRSQQTVPVSELSTYLRRI